MNIYDLNFYLFYLPISFSPFSWSVGQSIGFSSIDKNAELNRTIYKWERRERALSYSRSKKSVPNKHVIVNLFGNNNNKTNSNTYLKYSTGFYYSLSLFRRLLKICTTRAMKLITFAAQSTNRFRGILTVIKIIAITMAITQFLSLSLNEPFDSFWNGFS